VRNAAWIGNAAFGGKADIANNRPGGNVTGINVLTATLESKADILGGLRDVRFTR
jgi:hypothetical protein